MVKLASPSTIRRALPFSSRVFMTQSFMC
jgi:hypothetical protein